MMAPFGERLMAGVDAFAREYDAPAWFADYLKADLQASFNVFEARSAYEPFAVAPVTVNLLAFATHPIATTMDTLAGTLGIEKGVLGGFLPSFSLSRTERETWLMRFTDAQGGWVDAQGNPVVPRSLQDGVLSWASNTGVRVVRQLREKMVEGTPGLAVLMASELQRIKVPVSGVNLSQFLAEAQVAEREISARLSAAERASEGGDWATADRLWGEAEKLQASWGKQHQAQQGAVISEFGRQLNDPRTGLASTAAGQFWVHWQKRKYYYSTLNLLQTFHAKGLRGVLYTYGYTALTKRLFAKGTWRYWLYPANVIGEIKSRAFGWLLKPILGGLTALKTRIARLKYELFTKHIANAFNKLVKIPVRKAVNWVLVKLGFKALGAAVGSVIPGIGNAVGAVIGAVVSFFAQVLVEKVAGSVLKGVLYVVGGAIVIIGGLILGGGLFFSTILLPIIFNTNAVFPQEVSGAGRPSAIVATAGVCAPGPSCTNFQTVIRFSKDGQTHPVHWRVFIKNDSNERQTGSYRDDRCLGGTTTSFDLDPGDSQEFSCDQDIRADVERVIANIVDGTVDNGGGKFSASASVIIGDPGVVYPTGWPLARGCITQGPGGSYSHVGAEAIDISFENIAGDQIYSTHDGTVIAAGYCDSRAGNCVKVRSPAGFTTHYSHLMTVSVRRGDVVHYGQPLGTVGMTGHATGPHLHYEFTGLKMAPPYIPRDVPACASAEECSSMTIGMSCWQ